MKKLPLWAVVLILVPGAVLAQANRDISDEAEVEFILGNDAYRDKDFRKALSHYFASNRLAPNRNVRFNIARCYEQLHQYVEAFRYYQSCDTPEQTPDERAALQKALKAVRPFVGLVRVETEPPGASVFLKRRDLGSRGVSPLLLAVPPGKARVLLELAGYEAHTLEVKPEAGQEIPVRVALKRILGELRVQGQPSGAMVRVEDPAGPQSAVLPAVFQVSPGTRAVTVSRDGYQPQALSATVEAGRAVTVEVNLVPQTGTLVVQADERDALIFTDGKPSGFTPAVIDNLLAGDHELLLKLEGFRPHRQSVQVKPDERVVAEINLEVAEDVAAASRALETVQSAPASISLVGRREIESFGYESLADAISGVRGIFLSDDGTYLYAGVRGFSPFGQYGNRVQVQLDGHTLNDDWIGQSYLEFDVLSDLAALDRIEVLRGPGSALYGTGAFFGVINLVSRAGVPNEAVRAGIGRLSDGVLRLTVGGGAKLGEDGGFWISAGGVKSQGADYYSPAQVGNPAAPDGVARSAGAFEANSVLGRFFWRFLTLEGYFNQRDKHIPNGAFNTAFGDERARQYDGRSFVELRAEPELTSWLQLLSRVYADHYDYQGVYPDAADPSAVAAEAMSSTWLGAELRLLARPLDGLRLTAGSAYEYHLSNRAHGAYSGEAPYYDEDHPFHLLSAYAVADWTPWPALTVSAGLRFDGWWISDLPESGGGQRERFLSAFSPRAALIARPWKNGTFKLMGGRAFRAPSAYELTYWDGGRTQIQSPDLSPENIWSAELEYGHRLPGGFWITSAVFMNFILDLIEQRGSGTAADPFRLVNRDGEVLGLGGELELRREFRQGWMAAAQLSFQHTRNRGALAPGESAELVNSPALLGSLKLVVPLHHPELRLASRVGVESGRLRRDGSRGEAAVMWDVTLSGEVRALHLRYAAGVRNLLDWQAGYPASEEIADLTVPRRPLQLFAELNFWF